MMAPLHGSASQCQTSVIMVMVVGGEEDALAGARDGHHGAAVGGGKRLARQGLLWCAERDLAAVQAEDPVPRARLLHVVRGDQQAVAVGGERGEQRLELVRAAGVEAGERLVQ